jgi:hypothetical protein
VPPPDPLSHGRADGANPSSFENPYRITLEPAVQFGHRNEAQPASTDDAEFREHLLEEERAADADRVGGLIRPESEAWDLDWKPA